MGGRNGCPAINLRGNAPNSRNLVILGHAPHSSSPRVGVDSIVPAVYKDFAGFVQIYYGKFVFCMGGFYKFTCIFDHLVCACENEFPHTKLRVPVFKFVWQIV
jgi:hypothetical protein